MREDKFKPIEKLFIDYFDEESSNINADFPYASCKTYANFPPNDEPLFGSFGLYISCILKEVDVNKTDDVSLGILAYDYDNNLTINAEICWGYPGKIAAELFEVPVEVTEQSLAVIKEKLPDLVSKLREVIRDNPNGI
jgi:hypothetical protein